MAHDFAHDPDAHRYTLSVDGERVCTVDYSIRDNAIVLTRTYTVRTQRGRGYAAELVEFAVNDIEATTTYRIVPSCWYVDVWFDAHPERAGLLTR